MTFPSIGGTTDSMQTATSLPAGSDGAPKVRGNVPAPDTSPTPQSSGPAAGGVDSKQLDAALAKLRQAAQVSSSDLNFSVDKETGKTIIRVTDQSTGQLIRQIPSQELIDIAKSIDQMRGILIKKQA